MNATITQTGILVVTPATELEGYALMQWAETASAGDLGSKILIKKYEVEGD